MKKIILIPVFALLLSISSYAQKLDREKIKALKIAHITEQMDLSAKEAQAFWPIYNTKEEAENKLREQSSKRRKDKKVENLSETEAKALLLEMVEIENKKQELHSKFITDLLNILPAKKIIALMQADHSFKKKMIQEYRQRHQADKSKK
ncbi:hypothetical protein [Lacinutrix venerupis]|uniref:Sensor of ECF-type sigma factor n=1 Tax=Lacinutrix venerupis TaxID=1486034 RepID=A0AAC9PW78_9FLAO|nr:hypothetical protein [Lacinutrix venerupis]APX99815.1 hypothetical protein BWR22_05655 [Lacinutrix venerupis]